MAARHDLASPDRTGRVVLVALVALAVAAFVWVVAMLATAAFGT